MKKLFLDSANLGEIVSVANTNAIAGVTTNPSLMAKEEKGNYVDKLKHIALVMKAGKKLPTDKKHLSVEVVTLNIDDMRTQAWDLYEELKDFGLDVHIKIPFMLDTLPLITRFAGTGVKVNATCCMTADQAKMARDAGAPVISFFYNRMKDGGLYADAEIERFRYDGNDAYDLLGPGGPARRLPSFVICGSIRKPEDILRCWESGADAVTAPMHVIKKFMSHPKTDEAIKSFQEDIDKWLA